MVLPALGPAQEPPNRQHIQGAGLYGGWDIWNLLPPAQHSCCGTLLLPPPPAWPFLPAYLAVVSRHQGHSQARKLAHAPCSPWPDGHQALRDGEPGGVCVTDRCQGARDPPTPGLGGLVLFQNILGKRFLLAIRVCFSDFSAYAHVYTLALIQACEYIYCVFVCLYV